MNKARNIPLNAATNQKYELEVMNQIDNSGNCVDIRKWRRYLQVLTQLIGLISVKGDKDFENRQNLMFECCYANGSVILTHFDNRLQIWTLAGKLKLDANGDVEYADAIPFAGLGNTGNIEMKPVRLTGKNMVYVKSAPFGFSLWVLWDRILQDNVELMLLISELILNNWDWLRVILPNLSQIFLLDASSFSIIELNSKTMSAGDCAWDKSIIYLLFKSISFNTRIF